MADPAPLTDTDPTRVGEYALLGRLGQGGQGVVYLGQGADGALVAVKMLHTDALDVAGLRAQLAEEVEMARRVARFCTAQVLSADIEADPPYVVSEYVEGSSLQAVVRERPLSGAALERLAVGTITALAAIHQAGIVHRDFKPANVLMAPGGPRVIDFGIARVLEGTAILTSRIAGTPAYMAPEQITGGRLGPAVDLFAWGSTLVYAATGSGPFGHGSLRAVVHRVINEEPVLGELTGPLRTIAERCLDKDPAGRPTAAEALLWVLGVQAPEQDPETETAVPLPQQTLVAGAIAAADTGAQESAAAEIYRSYPPAAPQSQAGPLPLPAPPRPITPPPRRHPYPVEPTGPSRPGGPGGPSGPQPPGYLAARPPAWPVPGPPPMRPVPGGPPYPGPPRQGPATPPPWTPMPQPMPGPPPMRPVPPHYPSAPPQQHLQPSAPPRPSGGVNVGLLVGVLGTVTVLALILIAVVVVALSRVSG